MNDVKPIDEENGKGCLGSMNRVKEGDHVILQLEHGDDSFAFCVAKKGQRIKIKRKQYAVDCIIGATYGSCFEIEGKSLKRAKSDGSGNDAADNKLIVPEQTNTKAAGTTTSTAAKADTTTETSSKVSRDNRNLIDDNSAQKLQQKEIGALKSEGTTGAEIIRKLVENSSTFRTKTEFSQAKYLKRKRQKYTPRMRLIRPCAQSLISCMYAKNAQRVLSLRPDALSMLLSNANVCSCKSILVAESTSGLVLGAVAERLGGYGVILNTYFQSHPSIVMLERFNFEQKVKDAILHFPFSRVNRLHALQKKLPVQDEYQGTKLTIGDTAAADLVGNGMDGLIVCTDIDIVTVVNALLPLLGASKPFAVFSPFSQGLMECYMDLKNRNAALHLQLTENWVREFQILEGRTRPNMNMEDSGGFILSGIKL